MKLLCSLVHLFMCKNDLFSCVPQLLTQEIVTELNEALFVTMELDGSPDFLKQEQLFVVFCYVLKGKAIECFVEFVDCSLQRNSQEISDIAVPKIQKYNIGDQFSRYTYDEASVMSDEVSGINAKGREQYPKAFCIHSYVHKLNLVMSQGVKRINACKRLFSTLTGISAYYSICNKQSAYLKEFVQTRIPGACDTRWNS